MNKKIIIVAVVILAISVLLVACKGKEEQPPQTTEPEITTNVDENGAYVFNKNNEKVYLLDKDGFHIDPSDAVNMSPAKDDDNANGEEDGFYIGGATDGEKVPNISFEDLK
ncbi:MAG: hypothetical protein J6B37_04415 [Clostridia bacterium]|nr:hypothetical protein [Clostridia bacterium]